MRRGYHVAVELSSLHAAPSTGRNAERPGMIREHISIRPTPHLQPSTPRVITQVSYSLPGSTRDRRSLLLNTAAAFINTRSCHIDKYLATFSTVLLPLHVCNAPSLPQAAEIMCRCCPTVPRTPRRNTQCPTPCSPSDRRSSPSRLSSSPCAPFSMFRGTAGVQSPLSPLLAGHATRPPLASRPRRRPAIRPQRQSLRPPPYGQSSSRPRCC